MGKQKSVAQMGWENRNGRQYYYRKQRRGSRVFSEYIGKGEYAEILADQDSLEHLQANFQKEKMRLLIEANDELDNEIADFERLCELFINSDLILAGFYCHKGEWRRRRNEKI